MGGSGDLDPDPYKECRIRIRETQNTYECYGSGSTPLVWARTVGKKYQFVQRYGYWYSRDLKGGPTKSEEISTFFFPPPISSDNVMVQYHALGLLYHLRKQDRLAITKLLAKLTKMSLRQGWKKPGLKKKKPCPGFLFFLV